MSGKYRIEAGYRVNNTEYYTVESGDFEWNDLVKCSKSPDGEPECAFLAVFIATGKNEVE